METITEDNSCYAIKIDKFADVESISDSNGNIFDCAVYFIGPTYSNQIRNAKLYHKLQYAQEAGDRCVKQLWNRYGKGSYLYSIVKVEIKEVQ